MEKKGNEIKNWDYSYKDFKTTYTECPTTPAGLVNYLQFQFVQEDIDRYLSSKDKLRILEVGCGGARTSLFLASRGYDVTCADFSPEAIRLAKENFASFGAEGNFVQDDLLNSKLPEESFDCVMSFGLLEHFEKLNQVVKASTQLLKPGGIQIHCVITRKFSTQTVMQILFYPVNLIKNLLNSKRHKNIFKKSYRDFPHYENAFSYREYCRIFQEEGNSVLKCEAGGVLYPFIAFLPFGIGNFVVTKFQKVLSELIRKIDRSESKIMHFFSPTFLIICRKDQRKIC
ncbi:MAG: class I SAM-dependent methyltransferase [Candidatus Omnitrophota bacterium]